MKAFLLILLSFVMTSAFAHNTYDAEWCRKNGGTVEFDFQYNINFNCQTTNYKTVPFIRKIYNTVCIPLISSISGNREPLFLKVISDTELENQTIFDKYNYKVSEFELVRYI